MGVPGNADLLLLKTAAAAGGYQVSRSLRFNSADSAYLNRTPASSGNKQTCTFSFWIKRSSFTFPDDNQSIYSASDTPNLPYVSNIHIEGPTYGYNELRIVCYDSNSNGMELKTLATFRDPSAWYHFVVAFDTTQGTSSNRVKVYVNGVQQSLTGTYPQQNALLGFTHNIGQNIGRYHYSSNSYLGAYLAEFFLIDGQALDPTSFGEFDTNGVWQPIEYTGSYGTNGFHLDFADNSSAAALGYDAAGSNDWTVNNLSVTAGAGNDSLRDSPTNGDTANDTGLGGEVPGNYATLLDQYVTDKTRLTMANGNLDVTFNNGGSSSSALSSIAVSSGKWYSEFTCTQSGSYYAFVGIIKSSVSNIESLGYAESYAYVNNTGNKVSNGSGASYGATWTAGDVIGVALDLDAGTLAFYKNGSSQGTAYSSISGTYIIGCTGFLNWKFSANFGQRPFAYTAPSGFKALCTTNLPEPTIADGSTAMDVKLWTGTGSNQTITTSFSPDFVWAKPRSAAASHGLYDTVRGNNLRLSSNQTAAEGTVNLQMGSTGFTVEGSSSYGDSGVTYVGWVWDAGSSTVTNTQGSITSSVRANASAGFSIVTYTGNGASSGTIGHGLGVAPSLIIRKARSAADSWFVYHRSIGATKYILLQATTAEQTSIDAWNDTAPSSTVFSNGKDGILNGTTYVAYCFAPVAGYSAFGSYTSGSQPFVYLGFRPRYLLLKSTGSGIWNIYDTARDSYNVGTKILKAEDSGTEVDTAARVDFLSNGFKVRAGTGAEPDVSGTYIYAAFAEHPFQTARAR